MTAPEAREPRPVLFCVTPEGCTCGAPTDTPAGMHHEDCPVRGGRDEHRTSRGSYLTEPDVTPRHGSLAGMETL